MTKENEITASPSPEAAGEDAETLSDDLVGAALAKYRSNSEHERQKYGGQYNDARAALLSRLAPKAGDGVIVGWIEAEPGTQAQELTSGGWMARSTLMHMGGLTPSKRKPENELFPVYLSAPKAGAQAVTDEMVRRALDCQPFADNDIPVRVWQYLGQLNEQSAEKLMRAALEAALTPRDLAGKG